MVLEFYGEQTVVLVAFGGGGGLVDSPYGFFSAPCVAYLPMGVSCLEEAGQFLLAAGVESFAGQGEEFAYPVQVVAFPSAVSEGFFLHAAAHPVQAQVGQPDDVERVGDLNGLGQRLVIGRPVSSGQIQGGPSYVLPPPGQLSK